MLEMSKKISITIPRAGSLIYLLLIYVLLIYVLKNIIEIYSFVNKMLPSDVLQRYNQKCRDFCDGMDPFCVKGAEDPLPRNVTYFDIVNYCISKDSAYTMESFKAYKSMDSYKFYESGWVQGIACKTTKNGAIVIARVKHSMRVTITPLKCWISVDAAGIVLCGHCDCMAGCGEVCSHIGATLFVLEAWGRASAYINNTDSISCTDVLSKWLVPATKTVDMATVSDIVFASTAPSSPYSSNQTLNEELDASTSSIPTPQSLPAFLPIFDLTDMDDILTSMNTSEGSEGSEGPLMAFRDPFASRFEEKDHTILSESLQPVDETTNPAVTNLYLGSIFRSEYKSFDLQDLREIADDIQLEYSEEEINYIERNTRSQSQSTLWFRFRAGRITGSTFKSVCRTNVYIPAMSTIEKICYPESKIFSSKPTDYGKRNEPIARDLYVFERKQNHPNFKVTNCGLLINNNYSHCGVSPDGLVACDCCGKGVLEIKCPWLLRFGNLKTYLAKKDCPLKVIIDDHGSSDYRLKEDHEYYFQVQMEMAIADVSYCDFVVWNPKVSVIITIPKDEKFWNEQYPKTVTFFKNVLLPELLGTYFTSKKEKFKEKRQGKRK